MRKSIELRQERAPLLDRVHELVHTIDTENRKLTERESAEADQLRWKISGLDLEIEAAEDTEQAEKDRFEGHASGGGNGGPKVSRESQVARAEYAILRGGEKVRLLTPAESVRSVVHNTLPDNARPEEFSIGRALRGAITGNWKGADCERRALGEGSGTGGAYLVPDILSAEFIDLARAQAVCFRAGARTLPMDGPEVRLARLTSDATAEWKRENIALTGSDITLGDFSLKAKTLACLIAASIELLEDAANLDAIVKSSISQALALELDRAILRGSGAGGEIGGLRNWYPDAPAIQIIDMGAEAGAELTNYDKFSEAVEKILTANGTPNATIYAPRTFGVLDRFVEDTTGQPLNPPPSFVALQKFVTNQIPIDLTHGSANDASEAWVGDFTKILVGMRTQLEIIVSREAEDAFRKGQVLIRARLRADALPTNPPHFCLIDGIVPAGA